MWHLDKRTPPAAHTNSGLRLLDRGTAARDAIGLAGLAGAQSEASD